MCDVGRWLPQKPSPEENQDAKGNGLNVNRLHTQLSLPKLIFASWASER